MQRFAARRKAPPARSERSDHTCTIDPRDAKDYDDAIQPARLDDGNWQLGVHIAAVFLTCSRIVPRRRKPKTAANSTYVPGFVSRCCRKSSATAYARGRKACAQLCKSASSPTRTQNRSRQSLPTEVSQPQRLRYEEAQAISTERFSPHPEGAKKNSRIIPTEVVEPLRDYHLARR